MKEFIEKLIGRLEKLKLSVMLNNKCCKHIIDKIIEIVNELAEECKHCIKASCSNCEVYDKEKHYCPKWCDVIKHTTKELAEEYKSSIPLTDYDLIIKFIESEIERTSSFAEHDTQINIMNYVQQLKEQSNNGWIPCSERLPETYENVSICQSDGYVNVGWYSLNEFKDMNSILYKDVIAWQPLPAPYQPKGE